MLVMVIALNVAPSMLVRSDSSDGHVGRAGETAAHPGNPFGVLDEKPAFGN